MVTRNTVGYVRLESKIHIQGLPKIKCPGEINGISDNTECTRTNSLLAKSCEMVQREITLTGEVGDHTVPFWG